MSSTMTAALHRLAFKVCLSSTVFQMISCSVCRRYIVDVEVGGDIVEVTFDRILNAERLQTL